MSKKTLNLSLEEEYQDELKQIAEKNQRSMVGQIRHWIDNYES